MGLRKVRVRAAAAPQPPGSGPKGRGLTARRQRAEMIGTVPDLPETRYARSGDVNIAYQVMGDGLWTSFSFRGLSRMSSSRGGCRCSGRCSSGSRRSPV